MSVNIISSLTSDKIAVLPGEQAVLSLTMSSTVAEGETAEVTFSLDDLDYVFAETGTPQVVKHKLVSASTPFSVPYALTGPGGPRNVAIHVAVTPNDPPALSGTGVVIRELSLFARVMTALGMR